MNLPLCKKALLLLAALVAGLIVAAGITVAHDDREVGDYLLTVGFRNEPAVEGLANGIDLKVERKAGSGGHDAMSMDGNGDGETDGHGNDDTNEDGGGGHHESPVAVEGLEQTLQVEVTHVASGVSRTLPLRPVLGEPGVYIGDLIPTAPGVYTARFFGAIEGNPVDETFESGPGRFSNVESATDLHFPQAFPTLREIEGAVRGAQSTAEQAQDAAIEASDGASSAQVFGIVGLVMGLAGVTMGAAGLAIAMRRK